jgi:hypothetical protein
MPAARYDLIIDQGSDFEISIAIEEDGSAMNLTNYGARASMRSRVESETDHDFVATITGSTVKIQMTYSTTAALTAGSYVYDVEIFTPSTGTETSVTRILQGRATVTPEVTR